MQFLIGILVCSAVLVMLQGSWLMVMDAEERYKKRQEEKSIEADDETLKSEYNCNDCVTSKIYSDDLQAQKRLDLWARLRKDYPAIEKEDIHNG